MLRDHTDLRVLVEGLELKAAITEHGALGRDADIGEPHAHVIDDAGPVQRLEYQPVLRELPRELLDQGVQEPEEHVLAAAERDRARAGGRDVAQFCTRPLLEVDHLPSAFGQQKPCACGPHTALRPLEQRDPQGGLERRDLLGDGRLAHVARLGRGRDAPALHDREERVELMVVHAAGPLPPCALTRCECAQPV